MLHVNNLTKNYDSIFAVNNISFSLQPGSCVALLGVNGAGKTTTLRMLAGLIKPTKGEIAFAGADSHTDIRSYIGYLPQYPVFHGWMTGEEFLVYVGQLANLTKDQAKARAKHLLEKVGIAEAKKKRISKYSGGMRQRLGIAQAMIHQPKLLMLDEPVSSLDPIGRREILTLLEELKQETTILFSTHILNDAEEISDALLLMDKGKLVEQGTLKELRQKYQTQKIELSLIQYTEQQIEQLKQLDHIIDVHIVKDNLVCIIDDTELARQSILKATLAHNWPLMQFTVSRTTLEDLFVEVVGK
ncbi:ABC transporter ATP-binding protein [Amphibacillus sediminis]|uniref:ABC transporter ATP-binding protein n=1 Tax=Amphibacillus sediminis TaxID=360185 RepID=UPI0008333711|nr:ABC transporter ATP-binding protein [Amphibacillus sediminis]